MSGEIYADGAVRHAGTLHTSIRAAVNASVCLPALSLGATFVKFINPSNVPVRTNRSCRLVFKCQ